MTASYDIIFMGTPEFAVPTLEALHRSRHRIQLVVTQPDRPKGRGRRLQPSAVKRMAERLGIGVYQPERMRSDDAIEPLRRIEPDFLVVAAFGQILSRAVLDIPKIGPINVHASLLPKYRGAAPIQWAVINGETETGITTMMMDENLDTGDILLSEKIGIGPQESPVDLHDRLAQLGADVLIRTLDGFAEDAIVPLPQDHEQATFAPMLKKDDGRIQWSQPAEKIAAFIRGMNPWPGAYTFHEGKRLKIYQSSPISSATSAEPGTVVQGFQGELRIATGQGLLSILEIQGESSKRMKTADFLRGQQLPPGTLLT